MNIRIHSSEMNRMMKTIAQCIDTRDLTSKANIRITHEGNKLSVFATNGTVHAVMSAPVLGGDGESFCVDGGMFAKVCAMCTGEIGIITDGKICTVKGLGRTRLPVVDANLPEYMRTEGKRITVSGADLAACYGKVAYAVATDMSRVQLTGVLLESDGETLKMVALDGFQMSIDEIPCKGEAVKAIIPGTFMKLLAGSVIGEDEVVLTTDGKTVQAESEGTLMKSGLLTGDYVDYGRILPKEFRTVCRVKVDALRNALKAGGIVNSKQNLVKLDVQADSITVQNNSEQADYEAEVPCAMHGNILKIAFNQKYLMNTMGAMDTEDAEIDFGTATSPAVVKSIDGKGLRLVLPVRVMGGQ